MTTQEMLSCLNASPLLKGCGVSTELMWTHAYRGGQIVSDRAEGRASVGLVASGQVDVYSVAMDGRDVQLNVLEPGECFGISNLLCPAELETVLRCRTDTVLIYIPKEALVSAMEKDSVLALRYAAYCNQKIQFLIRRIELLTMQSCRGKVIEYLLSQKDGEGKVRPGFSREELARHLGVSRAALFRELSFLHSQGFLVAEGQSIRVTDPAGLKKLLYQRFGS